MAAVEEPSKFQSVLNFIRNLSDDEQNTLYLELADAHMKDPFHDITTCELCKHRDPERRYDNKMCCGCGYKYHDNKDGWYTDYTCMMCSKSFTVCEDCEDDSRVIRSFRHPYKDNYDSCVCNWCAVKCPERIECPHVDKPDHDYREDLCPGVIQNRHYNPFLIKCATKV